MLGFSHICIEEAFVKDTAASATIYPYFRDKSRLFCLPKYVLIRLITLKIDYIGMCNNSLQFGSDHPYTIKNGATGPLERVCGTLSVLDSSAPPLLISRALSPFLRFPFLFIIALCSVQFL